MGAGPRRTPLWVQSPIETQNSKGEAVVTGYTTLSKWWGERLGAGTREGLAAAQRYGVRAIVFRGGFHPGLTVRSKMVLATANVTTLTGVTRYDIQGPDDEDGRRKEVTISVVERGV